MHIPFVTPWPPRAQQGQSCAVELLCAEHGGKRAGRQRAAAAGLCDGHSA